MKFLGREIKAIEEPFNYNVGNGYIKLESIRPIAICPNVYSIGTFSVIDYKTKKPISFMWECNIEHLNIREERIIELMDLEEKLLLEEYITQCDISNIEYENYIGIYREIPIPMKITEFRIGFYSFSKELLIKYNKKVLQENKDIVNIYITKYFTEYEQLLNNGFLN